MPRPDLRPLRAVAGALLLVGLPIHAKDPEPSAAAPAWVTSSDRRYRVTGPVPEQNMEVASWAARFTGQMESALGRPIPWVGGESFLFHLQAAPTGAPARISTRFTPGGLFSAEVTVTAYERLDQEDLMEELSRLLLMRVVGGKGAVPAWYSVGFAQGVEAAARERDFAHVLGRWRLGREDRVSDVLGWDALPPGRYGSKASAAAVVAWLGDFPGAAELRERMFALWAAGGRLTPAWLAGHLADAQDGLDVEKA